MSFLPQSYEVPQTGNYFKFQPGKNRFRILGPAIVGNEFWRSKGDGQREPVRRRMNETIGAHELEVNPKSGETEKIKHFWAFPVWNYASKSVQVMELTQKSIMQAIQALVDEPDWGDPTGYDIVVTKTGTGLDTEYAVQPAPAKPIEPAIAQAFSATPVNMEALFSGGDPFGGGGGNGMKSAPAQSSANGGTAPQPSPAIAAAKAKAWETYRALFPGTPMDEIQEGFRQAFARYFPGRQPNLTSPHEWNQFMLDSFEKPKPTNPISETPEFTEETIPF